MHFTFSQHRNKILLAAIFGLCGGLLYFVLWPGIAHRWHRQREEARAHEEVWDEDREATVLQRKVAPDLDAAIEAAFRDGAADARQRVLVQLSEAKLQELQANGVSLADTAVLQELRVKFADREGRVKRRYAQMGLVVVELPLVRVRELEDDPDIAYLSPDRPIGANGYLTLTTGAETVVNSAPVAARYTGQGVGIAILDSGIDAQHALLKGRVIVNQDFTGQKQTSDAYGHGTYLATLAAGNNALGNAFTGLAPEAMLLNLRVLDDKGAGSASSVIAALEWCIAHREEYNIRVISLSLGALPQDSYRNDPLCRAARRAHDAGILVVAAAGNNGQDAAGGTLYGGINAPAIDPAVLTVGAVNTAGTVERNDDRVARFSSRGPTRGYLVTPDGTRHYDNLIKPDLVAPGNQIIGARAATADNNPRSLLARYPTLAANSAALAAPDQRVMYLSGTSVAAPVTAGAAALLFQARPDLTPNLARAILQYTAQPLAGENTLTQGTGELNIKAALHLTSLLRSRLGDLNNGEPMLKTALPRSQTTGGYASDGVHYWSRGITTNYGFLTGDALMTRWQGIYAPDRVLSDGTAFREGVFARVSYLTTADVQVVGGVLTQRGAILSDGTPLIDAAWLNDSNTLAPRAPLGNGTIWAGQPTSAASAVFGETAGLTARQK